MSKGPYKIKCGDCIKLIKEIPDKSIDLILTDPPYNIGKYSTGNIKIKGRSDLNNNIADWDQGEFKPSNIADDLVRVLKKEGNLFIFTSYNLIGEWHKLLDHRFDTFQFMVWHKTNPAPKVFKKGFLNSCEIIICCWNKGNKWNFGRQNEMHNFFEGSICMGKERVKNPKHPTQKPLAILKHIIRIASNTNDIVFDPFMGVGSTGVASIEEKRRFVGFEVEQGYFKSALHRIKTVL